MATPKLDDLFDKVELKTIVKELFECLDGYQKQAILNRYIPHWRLEVMSPYPDTFLYRVLRRTGFEYKKYEWRYFGGGSWSPECNYKEHLYTCRLCGEVDITEGDRYKHLEKDCKKHRYMIENLCSSKEYYAQLQAIGIRLEPTDEDIDHHEDECELV